MKKCGIPLALVIMGGLLFGIARTIGPLESTATSSSFDAVEVVAGGYEPYEGDLVFHESRSNQSPLIRIATQSRYTHVGIVHFVAMRLRPEVIETPALDAARVRSAAAPFLGLAYDWNVEWSDARMYCSELVWKLLDRGLGIQVGQAKALGDFDRDDPEVGRELRARFGESVPLDQSIVAPVSMLESDLLVEVHRN